MTNTTTPRPIPNEVNECPATGFRHAPLDGECSECGRPEAKEAR